MAVAFHQLDKQTHDEFACTYAALILHDDGIEITAEKIKKLIEASGNKVESYWPALYAKALQGKKIGDLLSGGGAAPAAAPAGGAAAAPTKAAEAPKKEEKKVEKEEEPDVGLGGGLFGDDDDF